MHTKRHRVLDASLCSPTRHVWLCFSRGGLKAYISHWIFLRLGLIHRKGECRAIYGI